MYVPTCYAKLIYGKGMKTKASKLQLELLLPRVSIIDLSKKVQRPADEGSRSAVRMNRKHISPNVIRLRPACTVQTVSSLLLYLHVIYLFVSRLTC